MTTRVGLTAAIGAAFLLAAAGCGGGSKKSAPPAATTTAAVVTTAAAVTTAAVTTPAATTTAPAVTTTASAPSFANAHNCLQLAALAAQISKSMEASSGNLQATITNEEKVLQALASAAPSQIRGDFETFATAFKGYAQVLAKSGYKLGAAPTASQVAQLTAASKALDAPKVQAAEQHLTAWARTNCAGLAHTATTG